MNFASEISKNNFFLAVSRKQTSYCISHKLYGSVP